MCYSEHEAKNVQAMPNVTLSAKNNDGLYYIVVKTGEKDIKTIIDQRRT
jgi:hypothetical protein